jgi:NADH-quinone oxidoreductase subunit J
VLAIVWLGRAVVSARARAPFLAFVQVIVYTGAVLMLFLFVLMLVGVAAADSIVETIRGQRLWAALAGIGLLVLLALTVGHAAIGPAATTGSSFGNSNVQGVARLIFTTYVFPFEVTSALLITAAVGAMILAHRERTTPKPTQRELSRRRVASGRPAPLPGPGTYARHNGVDMPALLPDGTTSRLSLARVTGRTPPAGELGSGQDGPGPGGPGLGGSGSGGSGSGGSGSGGSGNGGRGQNGGGPGQDGGGSGQHGESHGQPEGDGPGQHGDGPGQHGDGPGQPEEARW